MQTRQLYIPTGHPNRPATKINKVTGIVVHWTANEAKGADAEANRNYFARKYKVINGNNYEMFNDSKGNPVRFRSASAHLNVDDKELVEVLPWKKDQVEVGYHVGASSYMKGICDKLSTKHPNYSTIGLEICVNSDGDFKLAYANGVKVIAMMLKEHGLGIDDLYRHYDITGKLCPGFFTQDVYAQKYLHTTADHAWQAFRAAVELELHPSAPVAYCKVYQNGKIYKYQFNTTEGAVGCAKDLFKESNGKDNSIYATDSNGKTIYTPSKHPEDFPEFAPKPVPVVPVPTPVPSTGPLYKLYMDGAQQSAFSDKDNAVQAAKDLYVAKRNLSIHVKSPNGDIYYTPAKHIK